MANRDKINSRQFRQKKKCRKVRFKSSFDAAKHSRGKRSYMCFHCKGFHLTSQEVK